MSNVLIPHRFQVLALSNGDALARSAHYFWQAVQERRTAIARGQRPLVRADVTLRQLAEEAPKPIADRAADALAAPGASPAPSEGAAG